MGMNEPIQGGQTLDVAAGRRVHLMMWDRKITQVDLGRKIGMDQSSLGKRLRGERGWSLDQLAAVAGALDTSIAYLVGEADEPPRPLPRGGSATPGPIMLVGPVGLEPTTRGLERQRFAGKPHHLHIAPLIPIEAAPRFRELVSA